MRHGVKLNRLSRTSSHRNALMSNLACELISHKRIVTTLAKARALRVYIEPLLTKSKEDSTHQRRVIFSYLQDKEAIKEIFGVISPKIAHRPGGYTRIIKLGKRIGDNAESSMIELVDFNEIYGNKHSATQETTKKTTRRGGKKKVVETPAAELSGMEPTLEENKNTPVPQKEKD
ncbi:MAG: 50S ribosomal protein L17 [Chitinophagaceae bacterium]